MIFSALNYLQFGSFHRARIRATRLRRPFALARKVPDGQITSKVAGAVCPALLPKIFRFPRRANHLYRFALSRPARGAYHDRRERWDGMRWTRQRRRAIVVAGRVFGPVSDRQRAGRTT